MAKSNIPEGKKRYQVTLTQATVEDFQKMAKEMGIPFSVMSQILDESLQKVTSSIKKFRERGSATFADLFHVIGEEMDKIQNEVVQEEEINKKENLCPKCGLPLHKFHNCELNPTAKGKGNAKSPRKTKKVEG